MTEIENRTSHRILLIIQNKDHKIKPKQINLESLEHISIDSEFIEEVVIGEQHG